MRRRGIRNLPIKPALNSPLSRPYTAFKFEPFNNMSVRAKWEIVISTVPDERRNYRHSQMRPTFGLIDFFALFQCAVTYVHARA